jgi:hypothetical protein
MRSVYTTPILVAGVVLYGAVGAAGFATGFSLSVRAARVAELPALSQSDTVASCCSDATSDNVDGAGSHRPTYARPAILANEFHYSETPRSAALRYGIVELLPDGLTQPTTDQSAWLRATLEAATAAAIEPSSVPPADGRYGGG